MSLKSLSEADLGLIIENDFDGWPVLLTAPDLTAIPLTGLSNDISQVFDPDTGQAVNGRSATVSLRMSTVLAAGKGLPEGIANSSSLPWTITVDDVNGSSGVFKVARSDPDRALGMITLFLEVYDA